MPRNNKAPEWEGIEYEYTDSRTGKKRKAISQFPLGVHGPDPQSLPGFKTIRELRWRYRD